MSSQCGPDAAGPRHRSQMSPCVRVHRVLAGRRQPGRTADPREPGAQAGAQAERTPRPACLEPLPCTSRWPDSHTIATLRVTKAGGVQRRRQVQGPLSVAGPATLRAEPRPRVSSCVHGEEAAQDPIHPRVSTGFLTTSKGPPNKQHHLGTPEHLGVPVPMCRAYAKSGPSTVPSFRNATSAASESEESGAFIQAPAAARGGIRDPTSSQ